MHHARFERSITSASAKTRWRASEGATLRWVGLRGAGLGSGGISHGLKRDRQLLVHQDRPVPLRDGPLAAVVLEDRVGDGDHCRVMVQASGRVGAGGRVHEAGGGIGGNLHFNLVRLGGQAPLWVTAGTVGAVSYT